MNQTKQCTTCHIEKLITEFHKAKTGKYGVRSICKYCVTQYQLANKKHIAEYQRQHYVYNKEQMSEYYQTKKKQIANYGKLYRANNSSQIAERKKKYSQTPSGKAVNKVKSHNRRARKRSNGGKHTGAQILALFDLQSGKCPYCKAKLHKTKRNSFHVDHVMPLSKCGSNEIENLQLLCPTCNLSKHDKLPEEFAAKFNKLF